jgi:hypothetical protein
MRVYYTTTTPSSVVVVVNKVGEIGGTCSMHRRDEKCVVPKLAESIFRTSAVLVLLLNSAPFKTQLSLRVAGC